MRVLDSVEVPHEFHARFSAVSKLYRYLIVSHPQGIALGRQYYHHVSYPLDIEAMIKASVYFEGTHDFYGFMSTGSRVRNTVRKLEKIRLDFQSPFLYIDLLGGGFLYNMVRIIAGTLIEVGTGKIRPDDLPAIIASRDRNLAGPTAPAHGLCLMEVYYD